MGGFECVNRRAKEETCGSTYDIKPNLFILMEDVQVTSPPVLLITERNCNRCPPRWGYLVARNVARHTSATARPGHGYRLRGPLTVRARGNIGFRLSASTNFQFRQARQIDDDVANRLRAADEKVPVRLAFPVAFASKVAARPVARNDSVCRRESRLSVSSTVRARAIWRVLSAIAATAATSAIKSMLSTEPAT